MKFSVNNPQNRNERATKLLTFGSGSDHIPDSVCD